VLFSVLRSLGVIPRRSSSLSGDGLSCGLGGWSRRWFGSVGGDGWWEVAVTVAMSAGAGGEGEERVPFQRRGGMVVNGLF
jgi:hypothetical protein